MRIAFAIVGTIANLLSSAIDSHYPHHMTITNNTIGAMIDQGYSLTIHYQSQGCGQSSPVDLQALADRYGRDHGALHADLIKLPWRCDQCGGRQVSFRLQPGAIQYGFTKTDPDKPF